MNDEQLSALVDDELPADIGGAVIDQLLTDATARATWGRYHLIGDVLRTPPAIGGPALKLVPITRPARVRVSSLAVGLAAAAALAAVALIVPSQAPQNSASSGFAITAVVPPAVAISGQGDRHDGADPRQYSTAPVNQTMIVRDDEAQQRMMPYVTNFNELRARQRSPGVHPYVRIVGYETR